MHHPVGGRSISLQCGRQQPAGKASQGSVHGARRAAFTCKAQPCKPLITFQYPVTPSGPAGQQAMGESSFRRLHASLRCLASQ